MPLLRHTGCKDVGRHGASPLSFGGRRGGGGSAPRGSRGRRGAAGSEGGPVPVPVPPAGEAAAARAGGVGSTTARGAGAALAAAGGARSSALGAALGSRRRDGAGQRLRPRSSSRAVEQRQSEDTPGPGRPSPPPPTARRAVLLALVPGGSTRGRAQTQHVHTERMESIAWARSGSRRLHLCSLLSAKAHAARGLVAISTGGSAQPRSQPGSGPRGPALLPGKQLQQFTAPRAPARCCD